jgi:hypothetical protein
MDRFDDAMNFKNNNHCWHKNVFISRSMYLIGIAHTTVDVRNIFDGRVYSTSFRVVGRMLGACWGPVERGRLNHHEIFLCIFLFTIFCHTPGVYRCIA